MSFKKRSYRYLMSIPHLSYLLDKRQHQRYEPQEGLDIEIKHKDNKLYAQLMDISFGGMRIVSTDTRIEDSNRISLSVDDHFVELPCEKIRKDQYNYGFVFGSMDKREMSTLGNFIDHCTKDMPPLGQTEIMR